MLPLTFSLEVAHSYLIYFETLFHLACMDEVVVPIMQCTVVSLLDYMILPNENMLKLHYHNIRVGVIAEWTGN